uniref:Maturation protein n=1 Tax=Leviviridae sp. TaxID=2027243 RepID=A0A514CZG1_9VIRU|nr:MAG: hypothetical protein H4Bulk46826_000003 [Leviviridae sp.]
MIAKNLTWQARYTRDFSPQGGGLSFQTVFDEAFALNASAIVPGDRIHPNPWNYTRRSFREWSTRRSGGEVRSWDFPFGVRRDLWIDTGTMPNCFGYRQPEWDNRDAAYNGALSKLNDKVRGNLDLGVSLAEAGQTKRMIKSLDKVVKFAKIQRFGVGLSDLSRSLANGWLEWQYGWRPLLSDVYGALDEGQNIIMKQLKHFKARETFQTDRSYANTVTIDSVDGFTSTGRVNGKQSCTISLMLEIPDERFDLARWTSLNPVSLAWELIPYSFVVDWFVDVGGMMRNLETALAYGSRFRSGYVSEINVWNSEERIDSQVVTNPFGVNGQQVQIKRLDAKLEWTEFRRSILGSYPFPRLPSFKADLGSSRLFSAAALLRQLLKR